MSEHALDDPAAEVDALLGVPPPTDLLVEHAEGPSIQAVLDEVASSLSTSAAASSTCSRSSSPGQSYAAFANGVASAPGSPAKSQSQNTRWQAVWPTVAQIGHRSGDGWIASCSSVIAATTSRRRWL